MSHEQQGKSKTTKDARETATVTQRGIRREHRGGATSPVDWGTCDSELLRRCISAVASRGCAIQFGYTKDAGAYAVRFVGDGEPYTEYVRATEDIDVWLSSVVEDFAK